MFDAIDVILALLPDAMAQRREVYRCIIGYWRTNLTGIITLKSRGDENSSISQQPFNFMQFMVDCSVILKHTVVERRIETHSARTEVSRLQLR